MIYEENLIRERVLMLIHREDITHREFASKIGRLPANLSQILTGERHIPRTFSTNIVKAFPKVRREWLLFGENPMFEDDTVHNNLPSDTRPRLPKTVTGGNLVDFYAGSKRNLCQEKPIITQFVDYDFTLILKNNRMHPRYDRGDELAFKKATLIEWGNDYLIDTIEGPKFKKIYDAKDSVRCVSYNIEEYPEFYVPKSMILGYYKCVGVLRIL